MKHGANFFLSPQQVTNRLPSNTIPAHPRLDPHLNPPFLNLPAIDPHPSSQHIPWHDSPHALRRARQQKIILIQCRNSRNMLQQRGHAKQHERCRILLSHLPVHSQMQRNSVRVRDPRLWDEV